MKIPFILTKRGITAFEVEQPYNLITVLISTICRFIIEIINVFKFIGKLLNGEEIFKQ